MTSPDPGQALRRALLAWGLGHLLVGRVTAGRILLVAELVSLLLVAWLTAALADTSLYLVPFLAGVAFIVAWAWQAVDAYRSAHDVTDARGPAPERSRAAAVAWLSLPILVWGAGFWLIGATSANPAAVLDRFVTDWTADELADGPWLSDVVLPAHAAAAALPGTGPGRFRDLRVTIVEESSRAALAVAEAIHYERRPSRFLWIFPGSELVPVADARILALELEAVPVELPGGGDVGAVRWELVSAELP